MKIKWKIILLPAIAVLGTAVMMACVLYINFFVENSVVIPQFQTEIIGAEKARLKAVVQGGVSAIEDVISQTTDKDEIIKLIIDHTDHVSFFDDKSGYFFVYDTQGNRINVPGVAGDAKTSGNFLKLKDSNGYELIKGIVDAGKSGGGFVEYWFPKKGETEPSPKLSYVMPIKGTDYVIGTGVYMDSVIAHSNKIKGDIAEKSASYSAYIYGVAIIYILVLGIFAYFIIRGILKGLMGVKKELLHIVEEGDTGSQVDPALLARKDEIGELALAGKMIIDDFEKVAEISKSLSNRDWCQEVTIKSDKDVMNHSLKDMIEEVNSTLHEIVGVVSDLDSGAHQVSLASHALSDGATSQAASIEEISASLAEMSVRTNQNAQNASEASNLTQSANKAALGGQTQMHELAEAIGGITVRAEETKKVVKTIDDIAFQTNLLALNAAVEAARAGQHGKGFAVVAEEVRNLAARSAKAAGETAELIDNVVREVKSGNDMAETTAGALNEIAEQISKATGLVAEIAVASNDQAQGVTQVNLGLDQIDAVTQQNTASAEETAAASAHMSSLASQLNEAIMKFKLKNSENMKSRKPSKKRARVAMEKPRNSDTAAVVTPNEQIKLEDSEFGKF